MWPFWREFVNILWQVLHHMLSYMLRCETCFAARGLHFETLLWNNVRWTAGLNWILMHVSCLRKLLWHVPCWGEILKIHCFVWRAAFLNCILHMLNFHHFLLLAYKEQCLWGCLYGVFVPDSLHSLLKYWHE